MPVVAAYEYLTRDSEVVFAFPASSEAGRSDFAADADQFEFECRGKDRLHFVEIHYEWKEYAEDSLAISPASEAEGRAAIHERRLLIH